MSQRDQKIVRASIYPAIGIARVGNSKDAYFIGPETTTPRKRPAGFYKDRKGALKRQAARFRVFGLNERGKVVKELHTDNADIIWRVHVANKKASWFAFDVAMDIPQAKPVTLRNSNFQGADRRQLIIDPGPVEITGINESGSEYRFDKGKFIGESIYLGELRTDEKGRLLFLGGHGISGTPFPNNPPTGYANNDGWHDDISDGPVDAKVVYEGQELEVEGAWVACAPPSYAPDIVPIQTMYDVITDALSGYYITPKVRPSFMEDIYPLLLQFSMNQWVNQGFYVAYGYKQPYDFTYQELIRQLSTVTKNDANEVADDYREYRRQIFNYFRPPNPTNIAPQLWPWLYGDNMGVPATTPNAYFSLTRTLYGYLNQWVQGDFEQDWDPDWQQMKPTEDIEDIDNPQRQADMLTKAALWFCHGGPFHPGCELTWPMRLRGLYTGPYRIRRRSPNNLEPEYEVLSPDLFQNRDPTPPSVFWNGPGDITRWMACPWQTDTASCRQGYEEEYDPLLPTFWPALVPNNVLTENDYNTVIDSDISREERLEAFNRRASWFRILGSAYLEQLTNMINRYGDLGVVEYRPGVPSDPDFPAEMYVESKPYAPGSTVEVEALESEEEREEIRKRNALAKEAESIPYKRGLYLGPVGRATRNR